MAECHYEPGFIGRTTIDVVGADWRGVETPIQAGSLVEVLRHWVEDGEQRHSFAVLRRSGRYRRSYITYDSCWYGLLEAEPGVITWTAADNAASMRQGWLLCGTGLAEGHAPVELCNYVGSEEDHTPADALQIADRFKGDNDAWLFVWRGATLHDDPAAKKALEFLCQRSPAEYRKIRAHCLAAKHVNG